MECENCNIEHGGKYGSGRFCSQTCSRSFSTKENRSLINDKISFKLKGVGNKDVEKECEFCKSKFKVKWDKRNQKTCSTTCGSKLKWKNPEYKDKMRKISSINAKKQHEEKTGIGWRSRKNLPPSYPEKIAIGVLNERKVDYEREYPIQKYFIDFAIPRLRIAIEIDGQQHKLKERKMVDDKKDLLLQSMGWKVYRISYPEENIKDRIKNILADIPFA